MCRRRLLADSATAAHVSIWITADWPTIQRIAAAASAKPVRADSREILGFAFRESCRFVPHQGVSFLIKTPAAPETRSCVDYCPRRDPRPEVPSAVMWWT